MATLLTTGANYIDAGESAVITATLYDTDSAALAKSAITALTLTIKDEAGNVINSRDGQDILDTNGGTLATDGTLTLKLSATDNAFQGSAGQVETHRLTLSWTWTDDDDESQTGLQEWEVMVKRSPPSTIGVGWLGD